MSMKTIGNGLTLIALSTGGASLVRVAATIVAAFGLASESMGGVTEADAPSQRPLSVSSETGFNAS
jgi:hypothetical protein